MGIRIWTLKDSRFKHEGDYKTENIQDELEKIAKKYHDSGKIFVLSDGELHLFDGRWRIVEYPEIITVALLDYAEHEQYYQDEARSIAMLFNPKPL